MKTFRQSMILFLAAVVLALTASACSATPETSSAPITTIATVAPVAETDPVEAVAAEPTVAPTAAAEAPVEAATEAAPVDAEPATGGTVDIAFEDGRTWSMPTIDCYVAPDSAFGIFFMAGVGEGDLEMNVVESWPLDGDKTNGTAWIAAFTDETGHLYGIGQAEVQQNGSALSFTTGVYDSIFDLEPSQNGTFTCTP